MLDRLRELWMERPAIVAAAVIAPVAFVITLLVLFLAVGGGNGQQQQQALADAQEQTAPAAQAHSEAARQTSVVEIEVRSGEQAAAEPAGQADRDAAPAQTQAAPADAQQQGAPAGREQQQAADSQAGQAQQADPGPSRPTEVAGMPVVSLDSVMEEEYDEAELSHGSDGSEGGILPIDNGVVVSSREEHRTRWELIVPSAGLKSAIVRVGRTPSGAMGSPDNPYVIGWLDSTPEPGETGNALLAGHRDFEDVSGNIGTGVCWELVNTEPGDHMLVRDNEQGIYYVYEVTEALTLDPRHRDSARYLMPTEEPVITVITCTGSFDADTHQYSHRFVVVGVLAAVAAADA